MENPYYFENNLKKEEAANNQINYYFVDGQNRIPVREIVKRNYEECIKKYKPLNEPMGFCYSIEPICPLAEQLIYEDIFNHMWNWYEPEELDYCCFLLYQNGIRYFLEFHAYEEFEGTNKKERRDYLAYFKDRLLRLKFQFNCKEIMIVEPEDFFSWEKTEEDFVEGHFIREGKDSLYISTGENAEWKSASLKKAQKIMGLKKIYQFKFQIPSAFLI
jgi:hypothetical protein